MSVYEATTGTVLAADDGEHYDFLNNLATVKVAAGTDRAMSVVEFRAPHSFGPPQHSHDLEDELFIVLEGSLAMLTGGDRIVAGPGACAYLPRAVPHTFQVISDSARFIAVTSSMEGAPRFDQFVAALGTPTQRLTIPEPQYIDPARVAEAGMALGIQIVGPPPTPIV